MKARQKQAEIAKDKEISLNFVKNLDEQDAKRKLEKKRFTDFSDKVDRQQDWY